MVGMFESGLHMVYVCTHFLCENPEELTSDTKLPVHHRAVLNPCAAHGQLGEVKDQFCRLKLRGLEY